MVNISYGIISAGLLAICVCNCNGEVAYNVFMNNCEGSPGISTVMDPSPQPIGTCQNHGKGRSAYNSIEVLGCSDTCLCFKQYAAKTEDAGCDESKSVGWNIKMTCFDKCLQDCNGINCGDWAEPYSFPMRLQLTGSGQICTEPVPDSEFGCETTGMILDEDGSAFDDFAHGSNENVPPVADDSTDLPPSTTNVKNVQDSASTCMVNGFEVTAVIIIAMSSVLLVL